MARDCANTDGSPDIDYITYSGVPPVAGLATCSIVLRVALDSDCPSYGDVFSVSDGLYANNYVGVFRESTGNNIGWSFRNGSGSPRQYCPFTCDGTMRSFIIAYDGGATPKTVAYVNGASQTITMVSALPTSIGSGQTVCGIAQFAGFRMNGRVAEAVIYNRVITSAEALIHAAGYTTNHFPRGRIFYAPLIREVHDIVGGLTGTITGTTVSDHPRIYA